MKYLYLIALSFLIHFANAQCTVNLSSRYNSASDENYIIFDITSSANMSDVFIDLGNSDTIFKSRIGGSGPTYQGYHTYLNPGIYTATVTFSDDNNNVCTDTTLVDIPCAPSFDFSFNSANTLQITNTSQPATGLTYGWAVNFNQFYSTAANPTFNFPSPGIQYIKLIATTTNNRSCSIEDTIAMNVCDLNWRVRDDSALLSIQSYGTELDSIEWDFGDGNNSNSFRFNDSYDEYFTNYKYAVDSTYEVIARTVDEFGNRCQDTVQVVYAECVAGFTKHLGVGPNSVLLANSSSSTQGTNYQYNFGDGSGWSSSTSLNFSHTYTNYGTYNVCVRLTNFTNGQNCRAAFCDSVSFDSTGTLKSSGFFIEFRDTVIITGIEDQLTDEMEEFRMFPNPMHDDLYLDLQNFEGASNRVRVRVFNSLGETIVEQQAVTQTVNRIDLPDLANGIYILELEYEGKVSRKKLIKH